MNWLIHSKDEAAIILRTVIEAALSYLLTVIPQICGWFNIPDNYQAPLVGLLTVIITALVSKFRTNKSGDESTG